MNQLIIILLALGAFVTGTAEFVVSGILELISFELDISISMAGQLITIYSLSYAIGALILVMLTSKLDRKKSTFICYLYIYSRESSCIFFSYNFVFLMLSRVIMAMSGGLYIVVATNYAAQIAVPEKKEVVLWQQSLQVSLFH